MFGKKKKGDLGNIVFPEFPTNKPKEKAKDLPELSLPKFNADPKKIKLEPKSKDIKLPELNLPSFQSVKKEEAMKPEVKPNNKFAPPHEVHVKKPEFRPSMAFKKPEVKKPEIKPVVKQPEPKPVPVKKIEPKQEISVKLPHIPKQIIKHEEHKQMPSPKQLFPKSDLKPLVISQNKAKLVMPKVEKYAPFVKHSAKPHHARHAAKIHHAKPKVSVHKHLHHPKHLVYKHKIHIKKHHAPKISRVHHGKFKHVQVKPVYRALRHINIKGPVKPKDKMTLKRLGRHMSELARSVSKFRTESVKYDNFNSLRKAVEKEVSSIKKIYHEFDSVQRDFKKTQLDFSKSKKEYDHDLAKARTKLKEEYESSKKAIEHHLEEAKKSFSSHTLAAKKSFSDHSGHVQKSFHSNIESSKSLTSREIADAKRLLQKNLDDFKKSISTHQQEMLKKVDYKLTKLSDDNEALMKDLGKYAMTEEKLGSKVDVTAFNNMVKKINELETNTAANENQLDKELKSTVEYVQKLGQAFDNSVRFEQAVRERIIYHEQVIQELYNRLHGITVDESNIDEYVQSYNRQPRQKYKQPEEQEAEEIGQQLESEESEQQNTQEFNL